MRRALAAASATAIAGAALVVDGAGVSQAAPTAPAKGSQGGVSYERTVSESSPVWGDEITITNKVTRGSNLWQVYWIEDVKPDCLEYIPGSTTWSVSGKTYTEASNPGEVFVSPGSTKIDPPLANSWAPPITFSAAYRVTCAAGPLPTGGPKWNTTNAISGAANFSSNGPTIDVRRMGTSVRLAQPVNPEVNQQVTLRATTNNVPDGGVVSFSVDGVPVGTGPVSGGQATLEWTPTTVGTKQVTATFGETPTHGGSTSQNRTVVVSPTNVASSVTIATSGELKVGLSTRITATVSPAAAGGEVEFLHDGVSIGSAPVVTDGTASIDWIPSASGQQTIDANFSGRNGVNPSNAGLAVTVAEKAPEAQSTTTTLADIQSVEVGQETTLKATVTAGQAGGTVTFYDGNTLIGTAPVQSDGTATLTWAPTTEGDHTVRAVFSGHEIYLASQGTKSVFIAPKVVNPDPDPDPDPTDPDSGSLGSLTGSGGGDNASGSLGSLSSFGS